MLCRRRVRQTAPGKHVRKSCCHTDPTRQNMITSGRSRQSGGYLCPQSIYSIWTIICPACERYTATREACRREAARGQSHTRTVPVSNAPCDEALGRTGRQASDTSTYDVYRRHPEAAVAKSLSWYEAKLQNPRHDK